PRRWPRELRGRRPALAGCRGGRHGARARASGGSARHGRAPAELARALKQRRYTPRRPGAIAQLGERHAGSVEVDGSSPSSSIDMTLAEEPRIDVLRQARIDLAAALRAAAPDR